MMTLHSDVEYSHFCQKIQGSYFLRLKRVHLVDKIRNDLDFVHPQARLSICNKIN